ncbi:MAG: GlmU family protein [Flavobacteriales bacterium]|nr:GlmU family protein [Flavobacteriales bacterium]
MNYILFDGDERDNLLPLTYTRPVADLRVGILTIREKWEKYLGFTTTTLTEDYLREKFPLVEAEINLMINASFCPSEKLVDLCRSIKPREAIYYEGQLLAFVTVEGEEPVIEDYKRIEFNGDLIHISYPWDIFSKNDKALRDDFKLITDGRESQVLSDTNRCLNPENIFIEEGAEVEFAILNAKDAPIYIGKDAKILENVSVRGGLALCEGAVIKMGAKVYGATTIGPYSTLGGEVKNVVLAGYSNKGHEGYLGNSVLGEWCNLGADTNNSNLKNNYSEVKAWSYSEGKFISTGLQFCGLIMGDHSKAGINTMFNTGTVVGVSANIFGSGFPRNIIPSFSWGGASKTVTYRTNKAIETAKLVTIRKGIEFTEIDERIFEYIFEESSQYRKD